MLDSGDGEIKEGLQNDLSWTFIAVSIMTEHFKIEVSYRRVVLNDLPKKASNHYSCFFCELMHLSQFKMLKIGTALSQPWDHIIFKGEALLLYVMKGKLFEAVICKVLTHHEVKELIGHWRHTV